MISPGSVSFRRLAVLLAGLSLPLGLCFGAEPGSFFSVNPPPGLYSQSQLIRFAPAPGYRLDITVNDTPYDRGSGPLFLDTPLGTEKELIVSVHPRSTVPGDHGVSMPAAKLTWVIDRKPPEPPSLTPEGTGGGDLVVPSLNEGGTVHWMIWHPVFASESKGSCLPGTPIFVPEKAVLCAWGVDSAGNRGPASSYAAQGKGSLSQPFQIVNPVSGAWSNKQSLVIEGRDDLRVRYTLDGTDPGSSGLVYSGPVLLDASGVVILRLHITDSKGSQWTSKILYSVSDSVPHPLPALSGTAAVIETGEFAEFFVPDTLSWGIGEGVPKEKGGKAVLFTGVRGLHSWYPLTVSDGINTWRSVIGCGSSASGSASSSPVALDTAAESGAASVRIHHWYFLSIEGLSEVYAALDGGSWDSLDRPTRIDRTIDHTLSWYSPAWKNGAVQTLQLPSKPSLSGLPAGSLTAEPVFLSVINPGWDVRYRASSFDHSEPASVSDPQLSSGLLIEAPSGSEARYRLSFLASWDGIVHGPLEAEFTIDRKAPRAPTLSINTDSTWSRAPVRLTVSGEDRLETVIEPPATNGGNGVFMLEGAPDRPVTYIIRSGAVDAAGNRGEQTEQTVTVDRNALYVDSEWNGKRGLMPDGSPEAPYTSLDLALETIRDTGCWRVYLLKDTRLLKSHTLLADVRLIGSDIKLEFQPEASFTVSSGALRIESCAVSAHYAGTNPANALFTIQNGALSFTSVKADVSGADTLVLVRGTGAEVSLTASDLSLNGGAYAAVLDLKNSGLSMNASRITAQARSTAALSLVTARADIRNSSVTVMPTTAGRALEAWSSNLFLDTVTFERQSGSGIPGDTAIWTDAKTSLRISGPSSFPGFNKSRETAPR